MSEPLKKVVQCSACGALAVQVPWSLALAREVIGEDPTERTELGELEAQARIAAARKRRRALVLADVRFMARLRSRARERLHALEDQVASMTAEVIGLRTTAQNIKYQTESRVPDAVLSRIAELDGRLATTSAKLARVTEVNAQLTAENALLRGRLPGEATCELSPLRLTPTAESQAEEAP